MARIDVVMKPTRAGWEGNVTVSEGRNSTSHRVTFSRETHDRLSAGRMTPEELVRRSFEFLLAREAKESILSRFDLEMISEYFPEFEDEFRRSQGV